MSTKLSSNPASAPIGLFQASTVGDEIQLGSKFVDQSGNAYRWAKVGGTATVAGKLYQSPAEITNHQNLTPAAAAIGATSVTVTLGATAVTANQYAGGWLMVTVTPGEGYKYRISSHPAADASASLVVSIGDPLQVALTTSSRVDLVLNPYSGIIVNPTTASGTIVGVATDVIAAASFGWIQTGGVACVLADGANVVGAQVVASNGVAGAVEDVASTTQAIVGVCVTGAADTEYGAVNLTFDAG